MAGRFRLIVPAQGQRRLALMLLPLALSVMTPAAQSDPSTLPLVSQADLVLAGSFRVPTDTVSKVDFTYGGGAMAFNPAKRTLFLSGWMWPAEISIPELSKSADINALPRASMLQPFTDISRDGWTNAGPTKADRLGGLLVHEGRLCADAFVYYDANNTQIRSHFCHSTDLKNAASVSGWSQVGRPGESGYVAGPMTPIPAEWQAKLGGKALTGQCCIAIITRTSFGPSAHVFDPASIGQPVVPMTSLLMYPSSHATLGPWNGSNPTYGGTTQIGGSVIVPGTRSLLFFGSNGTGKFCYGDGVYDAAKADGVHLCYDPMLPNKGQHAFPYRYQVWAYDLNDLAAVKARRKSPWDVKPYGVWPLEFGYTQFATSISSVAIDPGSRRIYVSQYKGEPQSGGGGYPLIVAFDVKTGTPP